MICKHSTEDKPQKQFIINNLTKIGSSLLNYFSNKNSSSPICVYVSPDRKDYTNKQEENNRNYSLLFRIQFKMVIDKNYHETKNNNSIFYSVLILSNYRDGIFIYFRF